MKLKLPKIESVELSRLKPWDRNPRKNHAVDAIARSIESFGYLSPIVVQKGTYRILAGHGRLEALKKQGVDKVPVVVADITDEQASMYTLADNKLTELAEWDEEVLAGLVKDLSALDLDLSLTGFSPDELKDLSTWMPENLRDEIAPVPTPPENPVSMRGDLWELGEHRLLCGDSTKEEDVRKLLGKEQPALFSTDPPYCVQYTGNDRPIHNGKPSGKDWSHVYREIDIKDLGEFLDGVFGACLGRIREDAAVYMWHAHLQQPVIAAAFLKHEILLHQIIVWVKPTGVFGHSYFRWRHEPCAFGWRKGHKPVHGVGQLDTVWECDWEGKSRIVGNEHPCLHPDALVLTEAGWRQIRTVGVGDRVYAADGRFHPVTHVSSHAYTTPELFRITALGSNTPTLASDNHPFLIWRPRRVRRRLVGGDVMWIRADELQVGDYTMTPVMASAEADPFPDRDEEYWFLFGLYLAQGSLQKAGHGENRYPSFHLHKKRQDLVGRIRDRWNDASEYDPNDYTVAPTQGVTVMAFDAQAGADFERLGGRLAHAKHIAPAILSLPVEKRMAVLQGWLSGDGCRVHNRSYWQGKTVSADLAAHLALLGESVGYRVNVFRYEPSPEPLKIQGRTILSRRPEYHLYFYRRDAGGKSRVDTLEHEGRAYSLRRIKKIERVPYVGDVWNLSVEKCPSFQTSVGMSHNTQKPLELFAKPMRIHTKPGDVCLEPFSGSGSQIIAGEREGRRVYALEIAPAFVDVAVKRWQNFTGKKAKNLTRKVVV